MEKQESEKQKRARAKIKAGMRAAHHRSAVAFCNSFFLKRLSQIKSPELREAVRKKVSANIGPGAYVSVGSMAVMIAKALKELRPLYPPEEKKPEALGYRVVRKRV